MKEKEEKRLFPAQEEDEKILLILRKHWFTYLIFWVVSFLMILPLVIFFALAISGPEWLTPVVEGISILFSSIYLLLILALMMNGFIDYYLDVYIITDRRIVDITQNGLFKRKIGELNLRQIQDISAQVDGIFPTLLHFGNVNIQTAAEIPNFAFENIAHPYEISKKILDLHEAYIKLGAKKNKQIDSHVLDSFQTVPCYSKSSCDDALLKNLDKSKQEQEQIEEGTMEEGKEVDL